MTDVTTDKLAEFREAAKTANQQPKNKMTERAAANLRALAERDKANKQSTLLSSHGSTATRRASSSL